MRIRASFLLFVALIGIIVLGLAGWVINDGLRERANVIDARGLAATQGELLRLVELIGIERGAYNAALRDEKTTDPNGDFLAKPRKASDDTIAAALANGRASGHPAIDLAAIQAIQATLQEWRKKVERIGNLNYPDEARRQQIYGSLRMLVTINRDGTIQELRVIESSGKPVLDDAALRIVRLAAPFAPFTGELAQKFDQVEIIRTWRFERGDRLSSR